MTNDISDTINPKTAKDFYHAVTPELVQAVLAGIAPLIEHEKKECTSVQAYALKRGDCHSLQVLFYDGVIYPSHKKSACIQVLSDIEFTFERNFNAQNELITVDVVIQVNGNDHATLTWDLSNDSDSGVGAWIVDLTDVLPKSI